MSVTAETNRTSELTTDGAIVEFDFDMLIHSASEVQVRYKPTGGSYTQLTLNTDYGVVFTEDGGTVSTDGYTTPLPAGKLLIIRHKTLTQQTNWLYNDNHTGQTHQDDFDSAVMRDIQQQEEIDRCPKFLISSSTKDISFPEPVANEFLAWNAGGDDLANISISGIATMVADEIGDVLATIPANLTDLLDATITAPAVGQILYYNGALWLNTNAPTLTSITIGANTLNTTEWAFLDGLDQALKTTDAPGFATGVTVGTLTFADGSILDSGGAISFGNENLLTTGTLGAGVITGTSLVGGTLTLTDGSITDSGGAISFGNENLLTTGTLGAGTITGTSFVTSENIGIATDTDLLQLSSSALVVNGTLDAGITTLTDLDADNIVANIIVGTTRVTGGRLVTGGDIGIAADSDLLQLAADALTVNGTIASTGNITATGYIRANSSLRTKDPLSVYYLKIGALGGVAYTGDRSLVFELNNATRTITLSGNPTLADWFDQSVKQAASPTFANPTVTSLIIGDNTLDTNEWAVLDGVTANMVLDWTADQGATNIHAGNLAGSPTFTSITATENIDATNLFADTLYLNDALAPEFYNALHINGPVTENRGLTFIIGDAGRSITLSGNPTLGGQDYQTTGSPTFAGLDLTGTLTVDTINEHTEAAGITIDGVELKDSKGTFELIEAYKANTHDVIKVTATDEYRGYSVFVAGNAQPSFYSLAENLWFGDGTNVVDSVIRRGAANQIDVGTSTAKDDLYIHGNLRLPTVGKALEIVNQNYGLRYEATGHIEFFNDYADGQLRISATGTTVISSNTRIGGATVPTCALDVTGAIASSTLTVTASADNLDVSGVNTVFINITENITLGGLTGGVDGQSIEFVYKGNYTNTVTFEDTEGAGDQDFYMHTRADETFDGGGITFTCDGSNWYDGGHGRHV